METVSDPLKKQLEFYFSDANVRKSEFMKKVVTEGEGYLSFDALLTFKLLSTYSREQIIASAQSSPELIVDETKSKVKRATPFNPVVNRTAEIKRTIYLENVSTVDERQHLEDLFKKFGEISFISLPTDKDTGKNKGFAFIEYKDEDSANKALHNFPADNSYLAISSKQDWLSNVSLKNKPKGRNNERDRRQNSNRHNNNNYDNNKHNYHNSKQKEGSYRNRDNKDNNVEMKEINVSEQNTTTTTTTPDVNTNTDNTNTESKNEELNKVEKKPMKSHEKKKEKSINNNSNNKITNSDSKQNEFENAVGLMLKFSNASKTDTWKSLRDQFQKISRQKIAFFDYVDGSNSGYIRLKDERDVKFIIADMQGNNKPIALSHLSIVKLTDEEVLNYMKQVRERKKNSNSGKAGSQIEIDNNQSIKESRDEENNITENEKENTNDASQNISTNNREGAMKEKNIALSEKKRKGDDEVELQHIIQGNMKKVKVDNI